MQIKNIQTENSSTHQTGPRKLVLKKETLRQLTTNELRLVAGGGASAKLTANCP
jgi:hypothetical protein